MNDRSGEARGNRYHSDFFDELIGPRGGPRPAARKLWKYLRGLDRNELIERRDACEVAALVAGISFRVYHDEASADRAMPFDLIPRIIALPEWERTQAGLEQRVTALNLFIDDLYGDQKIVDDRVFPAEVLAGSANFRPQCRGIRPRYGVWAHICGSDLVRDADGTLYVLEDNLRVPSGVSYMLENRQVMKKVFPELFEDIDIQPVDDYPARLFDTLASLSPRPADYPTVVVLTPGMFNSAYFEHAWLAQQMGVELVEGRDLVVGDDDAVYMRTIHGLEQVDVIYRRIDDAFLDPDVFRADSLLGVPGLMRAWRAGKVGLANAPGAGVADDKVVYSYVPEIIRYYLDQEPLIPNVPTWRCSIRSELKHVLANIDQLVVKPANESGGYGMLIGPHASRRERDRFKRLIKADPRNYIAQPTLAISTCPTLSGAQIVPRHVDLRPFILSGDQRYVTTGGLTRVAMQAGSLVVNSSQGGGSKDTWIVDIDGGGG
ncbi:MAG: circularly permuted type 2 ATP-grasp protein [Wenzhouxiangella sp.]